MLWALLAVLGVPIWLIVGALVGAVWSRRRFRQQEGVFALSVRSADRSAWPRQVCYGRLVRDVLVVNRGLALVRTGLYPILDVRPADRADPPKRVEDPTVKLLVIDGQPDLMVAVPRTVERSLDALSATS